MMQKIILFTVLIITLTYSSPVSYSLLNQEIEITRNGSFIVFEGASVFSEPGQPELPFYILTFLVPPKADLSTVSATIEGLHEKVLPGNYTVKAALPPGTRDDISCYNEKKLVDGKDPAIYTANAFFPHSYISDVNVGMLRDFKLVAITVTPFRYNPVTQSLKKVISGNVKIQFKEMPYSPKVTKALTPNFKKRIKELVVNFDDSYSWYFSGANQITQRTPNYCIITTSIIKSSSQSLQSFIDTKKARGFGVQTVTESDWGGGVGNTAADNLRKWLVNNYQSSAIDYVLLIGNPHPESGDMPMKSCKPSMMKGTPTDFYFSDLSGNWDLNGNGTYGEKDDLGPGGADNYAEVHVGRIPVYDNDMNALDKILKKISTYEKMPASCLSWRTKALLIAKPYDDKTPGSRLYEEVRNKFLDPYSWNNYRIYDDTYGNPDISTCTQQNVLNAWTNQQFGYVNWLTHGSETNATDIMTSSATSQLNDKFPSIAWQGSCTNAHPETSNNLSYSLLKNGAVAAMGATRPSMYQIGQTEFEGSGSNQGIIYHVSKNIVQDSLPAAEALDKTKSETNITEFVLWINCLDFCVYGCPAVGVYTYDAASLVTQKMIGVPPACDIAFYNNTLYFKVRERDSKFQYVSLQLFTVHGKLVSTLVEGNMISGDHRIPLNKIYSNRQKPATGMYLCKFQAGDLTKVINVVLAK